MRENIPGIHNYCDRWCERCSFCDRCAVHELETNREASGQESDGADFWDQLAENLQQAMDMLQESMRQQGIEPEPPTAEEMHDHQVHQLLVDTHPLTQLGRTYARHVSEWLLNNQDEQATSPGSNLRNHLEVIEWYHHFIGAKLGRAVSGKQDERDEDTNEFPKDSDGSAKIALLAIERSTAAWEALYSRSNDQDILELLGLLSKMHRMTEQLFPEARTFQRPGFDEPAAD